MVGTKSMANKAHAFRGRKVWLYMVDGKNTNDLAILDSEGFDTWRGNPGTRAGDLIVMYRSAPFSDIAYVFVAASNARRTEVKRNWPWKYAVEIADGFRLQRVIKLSQLKEEPSLKRWPFLKNQRGAASRRADLQQQGVWPALKRLLEDHAPGLPTHFRRAWTGRGMRHKVFLSYASPDKRKVQSLYQGLSENGIDIWLDRYALQPAEKWDPKIEEAIRSCKAFVVCISKTWLRRGKNSYVKKEFLLAVEEAENRRQRYLFPVLIDDCIPKDVPFQATPLTSPNRVRKIDKFALHLRNAISAKRKRQPTSARSGNRPRRASQTGRPSRSG